MYLRDSHGGGGGVATGWRGANEQPFWVWHPLPPSTRPLRTPSLQPPRTDLAHPYLPPSSPTCSSIVNEEFVQFPSLETSLSLSLSLSQHYTRSCSLSSITANITQFYSSANIAFSIRCRISVDTLHKNTYLVNPACYTRIQVSVHHFLHCPR